MRIPAKVEYACKAVTELALRSESNVPVKIQDIADAQNIPKKFLVQILLRLKNAGLVVSVRGMDGGYILQKKTHEISLASVVKVLDDTIVSNDILVDSSKDAQVDRYFASIWDGLNKEIIDRLEGITFDAVVDEVSVKPTMYTI